MQSLKNLKFHVVRNTEPWEDQITDALRLAGSHNEIVALTHTPRNLGQMNVQIMWYLPSSQGHTYKTHHVRNEFADWDTLLDDTVSYLNKYIAPH
jgi:alkyl sulfatase BDS1-like metallo-beta-lactamase superfamily hydrolase